MNALLDRFGSIDIYLFDQVLRGNIRPGHSILDAGCGKGRNLVHFLREGYDVRGFDADPAAVAATRELAPELPADRLRVESVEAGTFPDACADVVLSIAVLHFARDPGHFTALLEGTWRLLKPGGLFFCRLATSIGLEDRCRALGQGRYRLPDGTDRFLLDEGQLQARTRDLGAALVDPLKTTLVARQRAMTTWVLRKA
jgi:tellurite methyltransferase